jgi:hypothetical protein
VANHEPPADIPIHPLFLLLVVLLLLLNSSPHLFRWHKGAFPSRQ